MGMQVSDYYFNMEKSLYTKHKIMADPYRPDPTVLLDYHIEVNRADDALLNLNNFTFVMYDDFLMFSDTDMQTMGYWE
jgi:hypothetical protein